MKIYSPLIITVLLLSTVRYVDSQENLSGSGTASQSSQLNNQAAYLAITGGPTNEWYTYSCSATGLGKSVAWWMLRFPTDAVFITTVVIMYRSATPYRLAGFSLYVSNSSISTSATNPPDEHLCFHDKGPELPSVNQTIDCHQIGRYVIIYNERNSSIDYPKGYSKIAILELCDIQVYGCYKTWSGSKCDVPCPENCIDRHCFPGNSSCVWGCKNGTGGNHCEEHNLAWYGITTQNPSNPLNPAKLATDGDKSYRSCSNTNSTDARLQLDLGVPCIIKTIYISFQPDERAQNHSANHSIYLTNTSDIWTNSEPIYRNIDKSLGFPLVTIKMDSRTIGRYVTYVPSPVDGISYVDVCELEVIGCPVGFYGKRCNYSCSFHCNGLCDVDTGACLYGCKPGWNGTKCDEECPPGKFGSNCVSSCYCFTNTCNTETGKCSDDNCDRGWMGATCSQVCPLHKFGYNCNETCHCLYSTCDRLIGVCGSAKCQHGWELESCSKECNESRYGEDCKHDCGNCLGGEKCDRHNGVCWNGCEDGWTGIKCLIKCNNTKYGKDCKFNCGHCINGERCDIHNGVCWNGCETGWTGVQCLNACDQGRYGENCKHACGHCIIGDICDKTNGTCPNGCESGWTGSLCNNVSTMTSAAELRKSETNNSSIYAGLGTFFVTVLIIGIICVVLFLRYRRKKSNGIPKVHFDNSAFVCESRETDHHIDNLYVDIRDSYAVPGDNSNFNNNEVQDTDINVMKRETGTDA